MATWHAQASGLLICLFLVYQEVSAFGEDCLDYFCVNGFCTCQRWKMQMPDWAIGLVTVIGLGVGLFCLTFICKWCCRVCRDEEEIELEETAIHMPTPPAAFAPPEPAAPPQLQLMDPPPYSEVAWKPYSYPPPEGQPPAYDNIAMDILQHP